MTRERQVAEMWNKAVSEASDPGSYPSIIQLFHRLAREDMREQCAKVCADRYAELLEPEARELAEAIRNLEV